MDGLFAGDVIGLPPLLCFGSQELQAKVVPDVFAGKKFICLAISEAFAGSDVAGMQTYAYKDGNEWVISGTKKYDSQSQVIDPRLMYVRAGGSPMARSQITLPSAARPRAGIPSFLSHAVRGYPLSRSKPRTPLQRVRRS